MRKRSLLLGDSISKLNLNLKAVKAEFLDEKDREGCEMRKRSIDFQVDSHSEGCKGRVFR